MPKPNDSVNQRIQNFSSQAWTQRCGLMGRPLGCVSRLNNHGSIGSAPSTLPSNQLGQATR